MKKLNWLARAIGSPYNNNNNNSKMWRCKWTSGLCRLVIFSLQFDYQQVHLQATLSKLLAYCVLRSTQPPTLNGMGNE